MRYSIIFPYCQSPSFGRFAGIAANGCRQPTAGRLPVVCFLAKSNYF